MSENFICLLLSKRTEYGDLLHHVKPSMVLSFRAQVINSGVILITARHPSANVKSTIINYQLNENFIWKHMASEMVS